jgi:ATP-binding cassette subfamily F protein uup
MHILSANELSRSYGDRLLFSGITFNLSAGDRVALVARNGTGKTTLMKILAGREVPEDGTCWIHKEVSLGYLPQEVSFEANKTLLENILLADHPVVHAVREWEELQDSDASPARLEAAMEKMNNTGAWTFDYTLREIADRLNLPPLKQRAGSLSGGEKRRLALTQVLLELHYGSNQHLLLLDEPTNHLDMEMVEWLAAYLGKSGASLLLVSHDRYFIDEVCNKIIEIEDNRLYIHPGDYEKFLERKSLREENESVNREKTISAYRRELEWMRKQPKARTTKAKSRVDGFYELEEVAGNQKKQDSVQLEVKMNRLGGKILELKKVYKAFAGKQLLRGFDYTFKKGDRIGIIGRNGVGKTTFLRMLAGEEIADSGKINPGETLVIGYYKQEQDLPPGDPRMIEWVKGIAEHFPLADGTKVSAGQFLQRFGFSPERQFTPLSKLSGGEKKRLQLLGVLFANPNFLILDEPTNDLDLITLRILEEFLIGYSGCLVLVSHDRYFMDRLVDHLFVFEGDGMVSDFPGNYSQFRRESDKGKSAEKPIAAVKPAVEAEVRPVQGLKKLSFKEKTEWEGLEARIASLEAEKKLIEAEVESGGLPFEQLQQKISALGKLVQSIEEMELRWLELSERAAL